MPLPRTRILVLAATVAMLVVPTSAAAQTDLTESQLVAAFVHRFGQYVEWPAGSPGADSGSPLVIGVFAEPDFVDAIRGMAEASSGSRETVVRELSRPDDLGGLAIVFLGSDDPLQIGRALDAAADEQVLTVGYSEGFAERGGMVNFFLDSRRMRFEVNVEAAEDRGIRLSSQLLRLARIVSPPE